MGYRSLLPPRLGCLLVLGLGLIAAACGPGDVDTSSAKPDDSTSMITDSSPGETPNSDRDDRDETDAPATVTPDDPAVETGDGDGAYGQTDIQPAASAVMLGGSVLAQKNFMPLAGMRVGVIASSASVTPEGHIVDLLVAAPEVEVVAVFSPEHGFRGDQPAGSEVIDEIDPVTGLPVFSLYGATRKPTEAMLTDVEVLVYDLQDVGTRYYTYISTMGLAMEAAAEADIPFVVLDRPNPRGGELVSGPVGPDGEVSFVSLYPIPSVYGLTAGELARAIIGEGWIDGAAELDLTVVAMSGWSRADRWADTGLVWTPPSPGLPSVESAATYPSVVLFEATTVSFGQGTDEPFTQVGAPWLDGELLAAELNSRDLAGVRFHPTRFTPDASDSAPEPRFEGQEVPGLRLEITGPGYEPTLVALHLLEVVMASSPEPIIDRPAMFDLLAGTSDVRTGLLAGEDPAMIAGRWQDDLDAFDQLRQDYFLYD